MAKFTVTIRKVITTQVAVEADTAKAAREQIESYGIIEAASDMSSQDEVSAKITSVKKAEV